MRLDISFVIPGMPFDGNTVETESLGGSETAAYFMARELSKIGHCVTMFNNCPNPGFYDGVRYAPIQEWFDIGQHTPHDVAVIQRQPEIFSTRIASRLNVLWCHDIALGRQQASFKGALWNVDNIAVLSDYMAEQYRQVYGKELPLFVTRNGLDLSLFPKRKPPKKGKILYMARPERGLDILLSRILPKLVEKEPATKLYLCGYKNPTEQMAAYYEQIDQLINANKDHIVWLGHLTKKQLYKELSDTQVYVYPTPSPIMPNFRETSCMAVMEAQASGVPVVSSERGALPESMHPEAGILVVGKSDDDEYADRFVSATLRYIQNPEHWKRSSEAGLKHAQSLGWDHVANNWSRMFLTEIMSKSANVDTLARHFMRHSDVMAAEYLLDHAKGDVSALKSELDKHWSFRKSPEAFKDQYEKIGFTHTDVFHQTRMESRYQIIEAIVKSRPKIKRILDYGCAHGSYAINLSNATGREIVGVDVSEETVNEANRIKEKYAENDKVSFVVGNEDVDLSAHDKFDFVIAAEVLEHTVKPWELLDKLERWVKPGADVFITVPMGPWEYDSYDVYPYRAHLWEFDRHDLREMFGDKKDVKISSFIAGQSQKMGEPVGFWFVEYKTSDVRCGKIDMDRKITIQSPRQTVSATIMAGDGSRENLHWCLNSIKHIADEVIIADCGMGDEDKRIAEQYNVRFIDGGDPKVDGFEAPRNKALKEAKMDWILWIDTDEKLIDFQNTNKYLRENMFNGYGIRQHHFACDTVFNPDMPVRLFRNRPYEGKAMRFWGKIHEHPELGLNEGPGPILLLSDVNIAHVGYLIESTRRQRFIRNYPLLEMDKKAYPERLLQKHFICRDNMLLAQYELEQNGGQVTESIKQKCQETIDLYRKYFRGKQGFCGTDTLQFYSQALQILGEGAEVMFQLEADKVQAKPNGGPKVYRFASKEDLMTELDAMAKEKFEPYFEEYW